MYPAGAALSRNRRFQILWRSRKVISGRPQRGDLSAIAIDQTKLVRTSHSTVGAMTALNDYFKHLVRPCSAALLW